MSDDVQDVAAPAADAVSAPVVESESLSDHEASFSPNAQRAEPAADEDAEPTGERRPDGTFKPRHRASSQRADADDVAAINAQTKRIKDAEAKLGADIKKIDGESDRVYTLRRRAELLERQATSPQAVTTAATPAAAPMPRPSSAPIPQTFPAYDAFITIPGCEEATYEDYADARADWRYAMARQSERQRESAEREQQTLAERTTRYNASLSAAKAKYPDFDTVVRPDLKVNAAIGHAIMASEHGRDIEYLLAKDHELRDALNAEITDFSPSVVASTRRYLDTLVAGQRLPPSSRTAAVPTGSALALAPPPAPRPPNPVRTGSIQAAEALPGDDSSLAEHTRAYAPKKRA